MLDFIKQNDEVVYTSIKNELMRQQQGLELIPSENFTSYEVMQALGSVLTNKYAEGYPGKRYYGGTEHVDVLEQLAIDRAKELFNAEHANVQPLSGAPANEAVYFALLQPGDTVLGMDLSHGGHLTHGHPVTHMAKIFNFVRYKTDPVTHLIDLDNLREMAKKYQPKLILVGYSAYSREIDFKAVKEIADEVGALTMADISHIAGLVAAGEMNNPTPYFDVVTTTTHKSLRGPRGGMILCKKEHATAIDKSVFPGLQGGPHQNNIAAKAIAFGQALQPEFKEYAKQVKVNAQSLAKSMEEEGFKICFGKTENHLILADITGFGLAGKEAQKLYDSVSITLNKNMIPDDTRSPFDPSGIRVGTPAMTTRGFKEEEFYTVGKLLGVTLKHKDDSKKLDEIRQTINELCKKYPLYPKLNY